MRRRPGSGEAEVYAIPDPRLAAWGGGEGVAPRSDGRVLHGFADDYRAWTGTE